MTVRIGVAGVGFGAAVHIPAFQSEGVEVVAVCTRRRERAQEAADKFGIEHVFTDYDEMLRMDGLDAVSIVTPPSLHHSMSIAALTAGKHVICEKPFALNAREASEMYEAARDSGKTAMVAHEFRYASGRMRTRELIDEGYIGKPHLILMRLVMGPGRPNQAPQPYSADRDQAARGAGFLFGLGSHYVDCVRHWFGEVDSVTAELETFYADRTSDSGIVKADADDTFMFTLHFRNGGYAQMVGTRAAPFGGAPAIEVYGSEGSLVTPQTGLNPPAHGIILGARIGEPQRVELEIPERLQPFADERDDRLMPFRMMVREFVRGIETGSPVAPSFYDGLRCQQILDAVRESAASGRRVEIPPASE